MGFYDQFAKASGEFENATFSQASPKGQTVEGVVVQRGATDFGGTRKAGPVPELILKGSDGVERQVACAQANLYYQIVDAQPDVGDHVKIVYEGEDQSRKKAGQSAPMIFAVTVTPKAMMGDKQKEPVGATAPSGDASATDEPF